jgi:hypothetical protein
VGAHGKGVTKRVQMLGRARATPPAAGKQNPMKTKYMHALKGAPTRHPEVS